MSDDTRTPTHCPHCGHDGSFGGLGRFKRHTKITNVDGGTDAYIQTWYEYHCPACDEITAMLEDEQPAFPKDGEAS